MSAAKHDPFVVRPKTPSLTRPGLVQRVLIIALIFAAELTAISIWLDNDALAHRGSFLNFLHNWGAWILRGVIASAVIFATFAWLRSKAALRVLSTDIAAFPVSLNLLGAHACAMATFVALSAPLYGGGFIRGRFAVLLGVCWLIAGISGIAFGTLAFIPASYCRAIVKETGMLWIYTLVIVVLACVAGNALRPLWDNTNQFTFSLVQLLLRPFVSGMVADAATKHIGTKGFAVDIAPECSGFEGAGLMLGFAVIWLGIFRRELRFPHAFVLVPAGVAIIFFLNAVRIAALILIGDAGASSIALGGFHSQAGWISFNAVALAFCVTARRVSWLNAERAAPTLSAQGRNATIPYLLPFVAIVFTGMLSRAATGDFEWFYPVRLVAAAGVLWFCRGSYRTLDWRVGWLGPTVGAVVFALWIGSDRLTTHPPDSMPAALAAASVWQRQAWLYCRVAAAVITVPIAEELAFRGFLIRRVISRDFESIDLRRYTWPGLLISSLAFGLLHGGLWIAGTIAGLLYGAAMLRRGRIGDAVAAHATSNALLAVYVLCFHQWRLW